MCRDNEYQVLLQKVLEASRAGSTVSKYKRVFNKWEDWCKDNEIPPLQADHHMMARYFVHLFQIHVPYSTIEASFYAIKWTYDCSPLTVNNPCDLKFLKLLLDGLKRILAKPVSHKEPITADILRKIITKFGSSDNLMDIRMCALLLVSFAGFFRNDELINLRLCDLELSPSHAKFFICKSKTDQYREGSWVVVATTGNLTCPVAMLRRYLALAGLEDFDSEDFLFKPVVLKKSINKYVPKKGGLSYNRCREILQFALTEVGLNPKQYGLHSLRAGGASAAAAIGVSDRLIKKQGRWKSDVSKDRYVKEDLLNQLKVSASLGL